MKAFRWSTVLLLIGLAGCKASADADSITDVDVTVVVPGGTGSEQCRNGIDDADPEDTLGDMADPGCHWDGNAGNSASYNPYDNDETNTSQPALEQCRDGVDNADPEDVLIDTADPGCHSDGNANNPSSYVPTDNDETNSTAPSLEQCRDGIDNADPEDTLADAADPGCHSDGNANNPSSYVPTDNDETNGTNPGFSVTPSQATFRIGVGCATQPIMFTVNQGTIASATSSDSRVTLSVNPGAGTVVATWSNPTNAAAPAWVSITFTSMLGQTQQSTIYFDSSPCQTQSGPPDFNFAANPTSITAGQSSMLSWSPIQNVASCPSSSFGGSQPITGTYTVNPTTTTTYTLTCANMAGVQVTKSATVTVTQVASCGSNTIQFSPNPISVRVGQTVRVNVMNWQLSFNSDCIPWGYIGGPPGSAANGDGFRIATMTNSEILYTPSSPAGSPSYKAGRWIEITGRATGMTPFCYQAGISNTLPASCGTLNVTP